MLKASTTPISSKIGRREGLHVAYRGCRMPHQGAPHEGDFHSALQGCLCGRLRLRQVPAAGPFGRAGGSDPRGRLVRGLRKSVHSSGLTPKQFREKELHSLR